MGDLDRRLTKILVYKLTIRKFIDIHCPLSNCDFSAIGLNVTCNQCSL